MKLIHISLAAYLFSSALSSADTTKNLFGPWYAQDREDNWWVEAIIGYGYEPSYPGSDEFEQEVEGLARIFYKDPWNNRYSLSPDGVSAAFDLTDNLALFAQIELEEGGGEETASFMGLDEIDDTLEVQLTLAYRWDNFYAFASMQADALGNGKGLVYFAGVGYDWQPTEKFGLRSSFVISGANDTHMDTEFNITAQESVLTGLSQYDPDGGLKSLELQFQAEYTFNDHWSLVGLAEFEHHLSTAGDSPLVNSDLTVGGLVGVMFRW